MMDNEHFTLIGICPCCAEPHAIEKADDEEKLEYRMKALEQKIEAYSKTERVQEAFEATGSKNAKEFMNNVDDIRHGIKEQETGEKRQELIESLYEMVSEILNEAPDGFGMELRVL